MEPIKIGNFHIFHEFSSAGPADSADAIWRKLAVDIGRICRDAPAPVGNRDISRERVEQSSDSVV